MQGNVQRDLEAQLRADITQFYFDPLGFVMYAYPWGVEGTRLADEEGPEEWQRQILTDIHTALMTGEVWNNGELKKVGKNIFMAVRSGHGIGKSTLMAWLDHWAMSTREFPQIVTTANTQTQLNTKTWREQAKWHKMLINRHWFKYTATKLFHQLAPEDWFSAAIPWSEKNPDAFQGTHEKHVVVKYDEASMIHRLIWEATEGAMTDSHPDATKIWVVFGNPTTNTGKFFDCFHKNKARWLTYEVDSRTVKRTDKKLFADWAKEYGEDSDFFRVRVKGQEPRAGMMQLIPTEQIELAMDRMYHKSAYIFAPKILGIDIARYGDDKTCFVKRQGLQCFDLEKYREKDTIWVAERANTIINEWQPDAVFLDMASSNRVSGVGVYDYLFNKMKHRMVIGVQFGGNAIDGKRYANKRAEMWSKTRKWIVLGGAIPEDTDLRDELAAPEYFYNMSGALQLERKRDMKTRLGFSPDTADALALTHAGEVRKKPEDPFKDGRSRPSERGRAKGLPDYDPLENI
jgi:hypothetical protein